jgi:hypothetical protein
VIPRRWGRRQILVQDHHHICVARAGPGRRLQGHLRGDRLHDRRSLLNCGGGDWRGALGSSTATTTADSSSTCASSGSAHRGWGRGSEGTTRVLSGRRFKGARLSMPVSAYLQEDRNSVNRQSKSENLRRRSEVGNLHLGVHPGLLHRAVRRVLFRGSTLQALLGGCALQAC